MGVDIDTYRGRIGTFKHSCGQDVVTIVCVINFSRGLKSVGAVLFVGILLLIAGIESNPGPGELLLFLLFVAVVVIGLALLLQGADSKELAFFAFCIVVAICLLNYASENSARRNDKLTGENKKGVEIQTQTSHASDLSLQQKADVRSRARISPKEPDENHQDKDTNKSLHLPTFDADKSSGAFQGLRPLREAYAEQGEVEYPFPQVSLEDTEATQSKRVAAPYSYSTNQQENGNGDNQNKDDDQKQLPTIDKNTGAVPKHRTLRDANGKRENENEYDGNKQPNADPRSGAIPKSRPRKDSYGENSELVMQAVNMGTSDSISKEEEYYLRLLRLMFKSGHALKEFFSHMVTKDGTTIGNALDKLKNNERLKKALDSKQKQNLLSIAEWDITIYAKVLLKVFTSELQYNEKHAIKDIRKIRNVIVHTSKSSLTLSEYDTNRQTLKDSIKALSSRSSISEAKFLSLMEQCETERFDPDIIPLDLKECKGEGNGVLPKIEIFLRYPKIYKAFKKTTEKEIKMAETKVDVFKQRREVIVCITFVGHKEDVTNIENAQSQVLQAFENETVDAVPYSLTSSVGSIRNDINSMTNVEFKGTDSGSIILQIDVFTITALLEVLQYIHSQSLQTKLDAIADELSKVHHFRNPLKLSAALSKPTLFSLFKEFVLDGSEEKGATDYTQEETISQIVITSSETDITSDDFKDDTLERDRERETYFKDLTGRLNLKSRRDQKISIKDVVSINLLENEHKQTLLSERDLPLTLLKQLISAKYNARDLTVTLVEAAEDTDGKLASWKEKLSKISTCKSQLSALDVFIVIFQCCDPMMKKLLVQKMYLSKLAIPFMYYDFAQSKRILSLWPLRFVTFENYHSNNSFDTIDLLDLPSRVFAFARFGRTEVSKSKLLNSLLSYETCNTFFNKESLSGTSPRHLNKEFIEMFWIPKVCTEKDRFKDPVVLLNLRGDIKEYTPDTCRFISNISDIFVIVINITNLKTDRSAIESAIKHFKKIIFVITFPEHEVNKNEDVLNTFLTPLENENEIEVEFTYQKNMFEISSSVTSMMNKLSTSEFFTLEKRLNDVNMDFVVYDEQSEICEKGKEIACDVFQVIEQAEASPENWKSTITPVQFIHSPKLGKLIKKLHREKDEDETEVIIKDIKDIREEMLKNISNTVRHFLDTIKTYGGQKPLLEFILCWLSVFIERKKRTIMPRLVQENLAAWKKRQDLSRDPAGSDQLNSNESIVVTENAIIAASFGIENLFREIGHIYDAFEMLSTSPDSLDRPLPSISEVASVYANLFSDGYSLELIDGESFYMPFEWIKCIMQAATKKIEDKKVFAISALGLQSSGKSTLLNTMFGLQFKTSCGRCTRGITIHLVQLNQSEQLQTPFDYVLVIDTEGLRAPELMYDKHKHDNELATVITGLGDITIINIMGENYSEMNEVLQVVVTAFLRLKLANRSLDVRKSCMLVQQNVTELSAREKLKPALRKVKEELDKKTMESAEMHEIKDIKTFDQLIEFDISKQVFYFPNMWQGNPPLAVVNLQYTDKVNIVKYQLIEMAAKMKSKSYKTLKDLTRHANDLWKGVLTDDFVFSFRNSLEIKAFLQLEQKMQEYSSVFDSKVYDAFLEKVQLEFGKCENKNDLRVRKKKINKDIHEFWSEEKISLEKEISAYVNNHEYKDIIKQFWEKYHKIRIEANCADLLTLVKKEVKYFKSKRSIDILINEQEREHQDNVYESALKVTKELKGRNLEEKKLNEAFNTLWDNLIKEAHIDTSGSRFDHCEPMKKAFSNSLHTYFSHDEPLLKQHLKMLNNSEPSPFCLFDNIGITSDDVELSQDFHASSQEMQDTKYISLIKEDVQILLKIVYKKIEEDLSENQGEMNSHRVRSFIKQVAEAFHKMQMGKPYGFKRTFQIKFLIYISLFGHHRFERHNADKRKNNAEMRLKRYNEQMKKVFLAHVHDRKAEETSALSLSQTIENVLRNVVSEKLPLRLWDALNTQFPKGRGHLMIRLLEYLVEKDSFDLFKEFNHVPKSYAEKWLKDEVEQYLYRDSHFKYSEIVSRVISDLFTDIKDAIKATVTAESDKTTIYFEDWIRGFLSNLKKCQILESECVRAKRELTNKRLNLKNFEENLLNNLLILEKGLKKEYISKRLETVEWREHFIEKRWGCDAQCPFCLEPCAETANHEGKSPHKCIQHRLRCCVGVQKVGSQAARLSSCNYDVQSKSTYICEYLNYICNPEKRQQCKHKRHKYRDYKKFFPNWQIEGTASIDDKPKFWMWFMNRFKNKISQCYKMKISNIPPSWGNISVHDALKSIRTTYLGK